MKKIKRYKTVYNLPKIRRYAKFLDYCAERVPENLAYVITFAQAKNDATIAKIDQKLARKPSVRKIKLEKLDAILLVDWLESDDIIAASEQGKHLIHALKSHVAVLGLGISYEDVKHVLTFKQLPLEEYMIADIDRAHELDARSKVLFDARIKRFVRGDNSSCPELEDMFEQIAQHKYDFPYAYDAKNLGFTPRIIKH